MNSTDVSKQIAEGYVFNINLPDWKSNSTTAQDVAAENARRKKRNQNIIAFAVLAVLIVGIIYFKKSK